MECIPQSTAKRIKIVIMTDEQIMNAPVWPSRLIFNASLLYRKKLKDLTDDELLVVKKYALNIK
jgi:hypothetical protein